MRGPQSVLQVCALLAIGAVGSCRASSNVDLPSDRHWSSAHFDYRTRQSDTSICGDILGPLEEHFALLQSYLGFEWPAGSKVTYYKFTDSSDFAAHSDCPPDFGGCAPKTDVEAAGGMDEHELVHAYLYQTGYPPWVILEGAAVALSCQSVLLGEKPALAWSDLASVAWGSPDVYEAGAWLVGYLLGVYGPKPFLSLYAALPHGASASDMDAAIQRTYGRSLADIWTSALGEDHPRNTCVWACSRPPMPIDGSAIDSSGTCGLGYVPHPFTLASEATVSFSTTSADLILGPCGSVSLPQTAINGGQGAVALYRLPAGSYFLGNSPVQGSIVAQPDASTALNQTCANATDGSLLAAANVYVCVPRSAAPWFLALPPPKGRSLTVIPSPQPGESSALCPSCGDLTACTDVSKPVPWPANATLMLKTDPNAPFSEFTPIF
jgi:hypothetical protein